MLWLLEIVVREARFAHDGPLSSGAKILIAVNGDRDGPGSVGMCVNVMRSIDVVERPAPRFQQLTQSLSRDRFHPWVARIASSFIRLCWDVSQPFAASDVTAPAAGLDCLGHDLYPQASKLSVVSPESPRNPEDRTQREASELSIVSPESSKFHDWRTRYGLADEHNGLVQEGSPPLFV